MVATILMATVMLAQATVTVEAVPKNADRVDVAYEELVKRQPNAAIERIRANTALAADDPARLINLGAAYSMLGDKRKARDCYRAAIVSSDRYELELADGRWMDSRRIARMAAEALAKGEPTLALR